MICRAVIGLVPDSGQKLSRQMLVIEFERTDEPRICFEGLDEAMNKIPRDCGTVACGNFAPVERLPAASDDRRNALPCGIRGAGNRIARLPSSRQLRHEDVVQRIGVSRYFIHRLRVKTSNDPKLLRRLARLLRGHRRRSRSRAPCWIFVAGRLSHVFQWFRCIGGFKKQFQHILRPLANISGWHELTGI